jgi:hypothetical protein
VNRFDQAGVYLLTLLRQRGVRLVASGTAMAEIVRTIEKEWPCNEGGSINGRQLNGRKNDQPHFLFSSRHNMRANASRLAQPVPQQKAWHGTMSNFQGPQAKFQPALSQQLEATDTPSKF